MFEDAQVQHLGIGGTPDDENRQNSSWSASR